MKRLSLRGMLSPCFFALALAAGILQFWIESRALVWLGLGFLVLGLSFARETARSLNSASGASHR